MSSGGGHGDICMGIGDAMGVGGRGPMKDVIGGGRHGDICMGMGIGNAMEVGAR